MVLNVKNNFQQYNEVDDDDDNTGDYNNNKETLLN